MPEIPQKMKALEVTAWEGPSSIRVTEREVPAPRPGHALVKVAAAGINFADVMQTRGLYVGGPDAPYIPGLEVAGEVVAVGEGVKQFQPGAQVMGMGNKAFAEYVEWPVQGLLPLPEGWTPIQGAAFPLQWMTAHGCLWLSGRLQKGESVLIHAAAGGVGLAAVQLAKHYGARVFATASTDEKLGVARRHGADELINYTREDFVEAVKKGTGGRGVDLILEMVGGETFHHNREAVVPFGRIVVFGAASAQQAEFDNFRLIFEPVELIGYHLGHLARLRPDLLAQQMAELQALLLQGVIQPPDPTTYPLEEASQALSALEQRQTTGKLVLVP